MIEVENLTKRFGDLVAVEDLSFSAQKGEILGFLGPNGAGKTTTMRVITGFLPATSGTVRVAGYDTFENAHEVRQNIGYLPENPPLYNDMTVTSYLSFVARIKGVARADAPDAVERVAQRCGLGEVMRRVLGNLSKGFRQRVGLAQALVHEPGVLVLDEPTIGLDPKQIIDIRGLIRELAGERTVILSTHILPEVAQLCSKVVIIDQGRIAVEGQIEELTRNMSLEQVFLDYTSREHGAASTSSAKASEAMP
jgi:ABC-2 type transport system ATP-binding protein